MESQPPRNGHFNLDGPMKTLILILVISCSGLASLSFIFGMFMDLKNETVNVSNGAFIIVATLAGLAFTYCQAVEKKGEGYKLMFVAGECYLLGGILFLVASLLKYSLMTKSMEALISREDQQGHEMFKSLFGVVSAICFVTATLLAHVGLWRMLDAIIPIGRQQNT